MTTAPPLVDGEPSMLIDGRLVSAVSGLTYPNVNPATEEVLDEVSNGSVADVERAVAAARRAFDTTTWSTDHAFRARCLRQLQQALLEETERLRRIDTAEAGRPYRATANSITPRIDELTWYADAAESATWIRPMPDVEAYGARHRRTIRREAVGVVAAITTWNAGLSLNLTKVASALATGNTVVLKPAPETPWQGTMLGRLLADRTDVPPGVVNVVTGTSNAVAQRLTEHPEVDLVTFTGSTDVGRRIMAQAAPGLKRLTLELGGKSAAVVLPDADLKVAVAATVQILCGNAGQTCAAATRLLLPRSLYDEGVESATSALAAVRAGDPWDPATQQGPQISARQRDRVLDYIETGRAEGLRLTTGGAPPSGIDRGYFVAPTLFADVPPSSVLFREEIFGPVLVATPYDDGDVDGAVALANDSSFGLHATVFGTDLDRAEAVASRLRVGSVSINGGLSFGVDVPFGGYKQSGLGRERGWEGLAEFLETKTVAVRLPAPHSIGDPS